MAKAKANTATIVLAKILGVFVENASDKEIAAALAEAGLTVSGGKVVKADKAAKGGKGKKAKVATVAQIVAAVKAEEEIDLAGVSEDDLREAVVKAKLSTAKKAKALDEEELTELLNEAMGVESEDDEDEDEEEDEDADDEDGDDEEEDEDEDEDEDEEEDEDEDEDEDELDLDNLDQDELLALVLEHKLATAKKAKKMDEDELRELCEAHFGGDEEDDEEEDEDDEEEDEDEDEDFDDEDEDEDDE